MTRRRVTTLARALATGLLAGASLAASPVELVGAHYEQPVERYGHFAPGRPHEYARIVAVTAAATASGRRLVLDLPDDEVFEDIAPRRVHLAPDDAEVLLTIVSSRRTGSRLAIVGRADDRLVIVAQSAPTGAPHRWLNPVGVADLDGDGQSEIVAVTTPHIGGTLRVFRRSGEALVEVAALPGFSNHVFGSSELRLSTIVTVAGAPRIVVPDVSRHTLALVAMSNGRLVEMARCELRGILVGPVRQDSPTTLDAMLDTGRRSITLADCR